MKSLKKLIPIFTLSAAALTVAPFAASCSRTKSDVKKIELQFSDDFQENYAVGDKLNLYGITVIGTFTDDTQKEIKIEDCTVTPSLSTKLTANDTEVTVEYKGAKETFPIYVYESTITYDTDTIERYEPAEPEKVYDKEEVSEIYFDLESNAAKNQHIIDDIKGHISDYAKLADIALIAEQRTKELAPIVSQTITFLINYFLGSTEANFIGQFEDCVINVTDVNVDNYNSITQVGQLSGTVTLALKTQLVDRTDPTNPQFLNPNYNYFTAAATITLSHIPYTMSYWQMAGQSKPYWGLAIVKDWLENHDDWSINIGFEGERVSLSGMESKTFYKAYYYDHDDQFPEEIKDQLIDFMQFQSFYLDELKGK